MFRLFLVVLALFAAPALAQDSLSPVEAPSQVVLGEPSAQSLSAFRKVILEQARVIASDKDLSVREAVQARANVRRLTIMTMHKPTLEKMHQVCAENALSEGFAQSYGAIDWTKLLAFIKEMIPIILELMKLFAYVAPQNQFICYVDHSPTPLVSGYIWHNDLRLAA